MRIALVLLLAACAARKPDGPPDTVVQIVDEQGEPLLGTSSFWSHEATEDCTQYGESCAVALPGGDYSLTFHKERAGRPGGSIGGAVSAEKSAGCLRARVHVVPGQKIVCRKKADFNCAKGVYETMDCGNAAAVRYGYEPKPEDEPPASQ